MSSLEERAFERLTVVSERLFLALDLCGLDVLKRLQVQWPGDGFRPKTGGGQQCPGGPFGFFPGSLSGSELVFRSNRRKDVWTS